MEKLEEIAREVEGKIVVMDSSVVINGMARRILESSSPSQVIIPNAVLDELQSQANKQRETGIKGLIELDKIRELSEKKGVPIKYEGRMPKYEEILLAKRGAIDLIIIEVAEKFNGLLLTSDYVQYLSARAKGCNTLYIEAPKRKGRLRIADFFTPNTMSVHLKVGAIPMAKIGSPGNMKLVKIRETPFSKEEFDQIVSEVMEEVKRNPKAFLEIDYGGATIVQLEDIRIAIARPPFSDGPEITAVRPVANVTLDDYEMGEILKERITEKQRGILIAGPPGAGKSTLAQAIAKFLAEKGYVVKTMEDPRDLQLPEEITQYTRIDGDMSKTAEILLLVRPDYTIFDEMRRTSDFQIYADMRLAGVGMIGVVHATRAIDAVQRLIGRVELGVIPQVVDTVIFVEAGKIQKVYTLSFTVKVPTGMTEEDLARPVIEVKDFSTDKVEYEIYTFGEQVVVMPIEEFAERSPIKAMAKEEIEKKLRRKLKIPFTVEIVSDSLIKLYIPPKHISRVIGKDGSNITKLEKYLGVKIDVAPLDEFSSTAPAPKGAIRIVPSYTAKNVILDVGPELSGQKIEIFVGGKHVLTAIVGKGGFVKIKRESPVGRLIEEAHEDGIPIYYRVA